MTATGGASDDEPKRPDRSGAKQLKNPNPYTPASIARGKNLYLRTTCQECHDIDGRALKGSDLAESADLTDPRSWKYGSSDGEIFLDIRDGTPGQMPGFSDRLKDDQIWHLVNYVRSIGPSSLRPTFVEETKASQPEPQEEKTEVDPKKLKNPIPYARLSIARGKNIYLRTTCAECHDIDGRALSGSDLAEAADLTDPRSWKWGDSDGHIFAAIRDGTKGQMPPFKDRLQDDQVWHLVNYIRSIGPEKLKPKAVEESK